MTKTDDDPLDTEERLAAIVSSSFDAIISKRLDGTITSWNISAERILGWRADEMIGQPILRIIPPDRLDEEIRILTKIRAGERVEPFDTVRLCKDGSTVPLSITVSPLRNRMGQIVGASKIARDITERQKAEDLQRILIDELNHRVKNTLAVVKSIAQQSLRRAASPEAFARSFSGRIDSLARAHEQLAHEQMKGASLAQLVLDQAVLGSPRVTFSGPQIFLPPYLSVQIALILHELGTNARKYGGLSLPAGHVSIRWHLEQGQLHVMWKETGLTDLSDPSSRGFGTTLIAASLASSGGSTVLRFEPDGLACLMRLPIAMK